MDGYFSRIYLYPSRESLKMLKKCDIEKLFEDVGKFKKIDDKGHSLISDGKPSLSRTRWMIVRLSDKFINELENSASTETLGTYVSIRQIKSLIKISKKGKITGYAFVIFHIIFSLLKKHSDKDYDYTNIKECITSIYNTVDDYCAKNPNDPVANFLIECYKVVKDEIDTNENAKIATLEDFPPIPKRTNCSNDE